MAVSSPPPWWRLNRVLIIWQMMILNASLWSILSLKALHDKIWLLWYFCQLVLTFKEFRSDNSFMGSLYQPKMCLRIKNAKNAFNSLNLWLNSLRERLQDSNKSKYFERSLELTKVVLVWFWNCWLMLKSTYRYLFALKLNHDSRVASLAGLHPAIPKSKVAWKFRQKH